MKQLLSIFCLTLALGIITDRAQADVVPGCLFNPHMVLQRGKPVPIWGTADPGESVTVRFAGQELTTTTDEQGNWMVHLAAMEASSEPRVMEIEGRNKVPVPNVVVGEVWLCSGQSNMAMSVSGSDAADQALAGGDLPLVRVATVRKGADLEPRAVSPHRFGWQRADAGHIGAYSAVAFYFARQLQRELDVPVGVIVSAWGGTPIEAWMPRKAIDADPKLTGLAQKIADADAEYARLVKEHEAAVAALREGEQAPSPPNHPLRKKQSPTVLYNAMIRPVVPYAIRGFLWYQGESNVMQGKPTADYADLLRVLIASWREDFGGGDLPFAVVQISPYEYKQLERLPVIWQAQTDVLKLPGTGLIVTTDIAPFDNIHPPNKLDVGQRAARWALAKVYGRDDVVYSGPIYKSFAIEGNRVRIRFDHTGSGLAARDDQPLAAFTIAGADGQFVPALASIDGDTVVVYGDQVPQPTAVRYGWTQHDQMVLMNKEGLPAPAFATDAP